MGFASDGESAGVEQHPLYVQGIRYFQAGEWQKAILCFEKLAERHGASQPVQHALNEARFRAKFDEATPVRPKPCSRCLCSLARRFGSLSTAGST